MDGDPISDCASPNVQEMRTSSTWMNRSAEQDPLVTQRYMIHANNCGYVVHDSPLGTACCAAHLA